jgi:hypothetical protein
MTTNSSSENAVLKYRRKRIDKRLSGFISGMGT